MADSTMTPTAITVDKVKANGSKVAPIFNFFRLKGGDRPKMGAELVEWSKSEASTSDLTVCKWAAKVIEPRNYAGVDWDKDPQNILDEQISLPDWLEVMKLFMASFRSLLGVSTQPEG